MRIDGIDDVPDALRYAPVAALRFLEGHRALPQAPHHVVEGARKDAELVRAFLLDHVRQVSPRDPLRAEEQRIEGARVETAKAPPRSTAMVSPTRK